MAQLDGALPEGVPVDTTHDPLRFAALLQGCSIFITCDTGPMHLAVAVGTPTIAIFRRSNFREYGPLGHRHRIVYDKAGIGLDRVVQAVEDLFGEASQLSSPVESSPNSYPD
ncbi:MAG: hypothetical protein KJT03_03830 [Verrucomicrobiae bacterium]|nr:hypothetical protein [Verrucomicrobiae bacterium]